MPNIETIPARALERNDRVYLAVDEMPYLVDSVTNMGDSVRVTYSSGDVIEYAAGHELAIRF